MARAEYDVIVVGAGPGGSACALTLARAGANVLLLEKAKIPGERNSSGGIVYGAFTKNYGLINLLPEFENEAPVQRKIVAHEVTMLSEPDWDKGEYRYYTLNRDSIPSRVGLFNVELETGHDYSVLRRDFDQWFANEAVEAGAMLSTQTTVEDLLKDSGGAVVGVRTEREELYPRLVVDCSGVTTNLVEAAGLGRIPSPRSLYNGLKHVYRLDPDAIEKRFRLSKDRGKAVFYLGRFMHGISGGAFIYTNRDSLSVGVVVSMDAMIRAFTERFDQVGKLLDVLQEFEAHPAVAELLEGAEMVEYSAHNIPRGPKTMLKRPYADGYLVAGDALGAFVKIGPLIDGMRRAIASGIMAAETFIEANASGSFKASNLSKYKDRLAPIYDDVSRSGRDAFVSESSFVYQTLPGLLFSTSLFSKKGRIKDPKGAEWSLKNDAVQRVQQRTSILNYDEDEHYSHIKVDLELAGKSMTKPWVPSCPVNCYGLLTPKGLFFSFKDLYDVNLKQLRGEKGKAVGSGGTANSTEAYRITIRDIEAGQVRFDHVPCVECGTCGEIGPKDIVTFTSERDGHGVRYRYG